ncbi:NEP1-interacting protein 1-like [Syzygium oleosum]|uniref:NEP1-interacting protein 1-like n=1 Tax=Syzygium oleosum TaxID=219896 RepID=UPI0024B87BD2|nr:NEP1-interacting protein 1-like [Syzygium oleosum]
MEKAWVRCCDGVSAIVFTVSYAVSLFFLAIVGSTLGAFVGILIGVKSRNNLFYTVVVGAIAGGKFLTNAFRMSISFWLSDDCFFSNILQSTDSTTELDAGELVQPLLYSLTLSRLEQTLAHADNMISEITVDHAKVSKNLCDRIPRIKITEDRLLDSSRNRNSCSICLQDFECKDEARRLPNCRHLFHLHCIDKWICKQRSCPLCRSPVVQVN